MNPISFQREKKRTYTSDITLETINPVSSEDKPHLERPESPTESEMPITIVNNLSYEMILRSKKKNSLQVAIVPESPSLVLKKGGVISKASVNNVRSRTQNAEQSKFTRPHLYA